MKDALSEPHSAMESVLLRKQKICFIIISLVVSPHSFSLASLLPLVVNSLSIMHAIKKENDIMNRMCR